MEREFELGFEGKEWFAVVRISRRQGYANVLIEKSANENPMNVSYSVIRARLLDQESWFLPYNETELENNLQLEQTDYYKNKKDMNTMRLMKPLTGLILLLMLAGLTGSENKLSNTRLDRKSAEQG